MKSAVTLTREVMSTLQKEADDINTNLCEIIDSITDEDGKPLTGTDEKLLEAIREIGYQLLQHTENIQFERGCLIAQIEDEKQRVWKLRAV